MRVLVYLEGDCISALCRWSWFYLVRLLWLPTTSFISFTYTKSQVYWALLKLAEERMFTRISECHAYFWLDSIFGWPKQIRTLMFNHRDAERERKKNNNKNHKPFVCFFELFLWNPKKIPLFHLFMYCFNRISKHFAEYHYGWKKLD